MELRFLSKKKVVENEKKIKIEFSWKSGRERVLKNEIHSDESLIRDT